MNEEQEREWRQEREMLLARLALEKKNVANYVESTKLYQRWYEQAARQRDQARAQRDAAHDLLRKVRRK